MGCLIGIAVAVVFIVVVCFTSGQPVAGIAFLGGVAIWFLAITQNSGKR